MNICPIEKYFKQKCSLPNFTRKSFSPYKFFGNYPRTVTKEDLQ